MNGWRSFFPQQRNDFQLELTCYSNVQSFFAWHSTCAKFSDHNCEFNYSLSYSQKYGHSIRSVNLKKASLLRTSFDPRGSRDLNKYLRKGFCAKMFPWSYTNFQKTTTTSVLARRCCTQRVFWYRAQTLRTHVARGTIPEKPRVFVRPADHH